MKTILSKVLLWAEFQLPESRGVWVSDLRAEAIHIPAGLSRQKFLLSGLIVALSEILRFRFGVQRVGQMLLGFALLTLCLGGLVISIDMPDGIVRVTFYGALILYTLAGLIAFVDLKMMKNFTFGCGLFLIGTSIAFGLNLFPTLIAHSEFLRAFTLEAAAMMAGLFVAASYLGWVEGADHA